MPNIYNRQSGNSCIILGPFEFLVYPFNFGNYKEIRVGAGFSSMTATGNFLQPITQETVFQKSPNSYFYFGVKPYSNLMPYQETGHGFIGYMIGADGNVGAQGINIDLGNVIGVLRTQNTFTTNYGNIVSGAPVASGNLSNNGFYVNCQSLPLLQGASTLNGFSLQITDVGLTTQGYNFKGLNNNVSDGFMKTGILNFNAVISGLNGQLTSATSSKTGFFTLNGAGFSGNPLPLPNAVFIYNPFSTISLIIEELAIIKYS